MRWSLFFVLLFASSGTAMSQSAGQNSFTPFCIYTVAPCPTPDTSAAIRARHHPPRTDRMHVQLGYIDTNIATVSELINNLGIGLVLIPDNNFDIISFVVSRAQPGRDFEGPYEIRGTKVPQWLREKLFCHFLPGSMFFFEGVVLRKKGSDHTATLDGVVMIKTPR